MPDPTVRDLETGYYVYGVVPVLEGAPARPPLIGIDDAEVEYVEHEDVAAAVAVIALERPPGRRAELMAHSAVVEALSERGPVVPVQFGSVMEDGDSVVHDLLERDHDYYVDLLERLRGLHQFRLQGTYVQDQVLAELVAQRPDIADLRRRTRELPEGVMHPALVELGELVSAAMDHLREQDADTVLDVVEPLVGGHPSPPQRRRRWPAGRGPAGGGCAGGRAGVRSWRLLAEAVHERIRLSLSGPMAPFDFVEGEPWD